MDSRIPAATITPLVLFGWFAVILACPPALAGGWFERNSGKPSPRFAILIDPVETLSGLYSGVFTIRPQFQAAVHKHIVLDTSALITWAPGGFGERRLTVWGGGAMAGLRLVLARLAGPYLATRAGPMALEGGDLRRVLVLVEIEIGWSWSARKRGLVMNAGLGWRAWIPADRDTRLHYVTSHALLVSYALGFGW